MSSLSLAFRCAVAATFIIFGGELSQAQSLSDSTAKMVIEIDGNKLLLHGDVSSAANEAKLREVAASSYAPDDADIALTLSDEVPPGWSLITELTLRASLATQHSAAEITPARVSVSGLSADLEAWQARAARLRENLLPGMSAAFAVVEPAPPPSGPSMCQEIFNRVARSRSIDFFHSSDQLTTSVYGLLDELAQIAGDCPGGTITVTGHTDNSGEESLNLALSEARAQAVVRYMEARGISAERLSASGAGSSMPIDRNDSSAARRRNRRIDIVYSDQ